MPKTIRYVVLGMVILVDTYVFYNAIIRAEWAVQQQPIMAYATMLYGQVSTQLLFGIMVLLSILIATQLARK